MHRKNIHSVPFLCLIMIYFVLMIFNFSVNMMLLLALLILILIFVTSPRMILSWKIPCFALLFSLGIFVFYLFYPNEQVYSGEALAVFGDFTIDSGVLKNALLHWLKIFLITTVSLYSGNVFQYEEFVFSLMTTRSIFKIPVKWGYAILVGFYSIGHIKDELDQVRINKKMRNIKKQSMFDYLFLLLVFAFRYSERKSLSLITRNLSLDKTFYGEFSPTGKQRQNLYCVLALWSVVIWGYVRFTM